ncbi:ligand of numb-protein X 2 [Chamberlinius hualienensis]
MRKVQQQQQQQQQPQLNASGFSCVVCGQFHPVGDVHLYNYIGDVDEDLTCHICLQPLVRPLDTHCGHTFCQPCLNSHLRIHSFCPIDRGTLSLMDCRPASLMVQRLLDKLMVECPNQSVCSQKIARSDLEAHLTSRCPGSVTMCPMFNYGCSFRAHRSQISSHTETCPYRNQAENLQPKHSRSSSTPGRVESMEFLDSIGATCSPSPSASSASSANSSVIKEGAISRIEIRPSASNGALGMSIVGGCDSPLKCIILQSIYPGGAAALDGRLQAGDQLVEVNGMDLTNCSHHQVISTLKNGGTSVRLAVYREQLESTSMSLTTTPPESLQQQSSNGEKTFRVTLDRTPGKPLGIRVVEKRHQPGVYISDVISGSIAGRDGRIKPDDRILEINGRDMRKAKIEEASQLIQLSTKRIDFLVSRTTPPSSPSFPNDKMEVESSPTSLSTSTSSLVASSAVALPLSLPPPPLPPKVVGGCDGSTNNNNNSSSKFSTISCRINPDTRYLVHSKGSHESLGIRVAGGLESHQGNTPVYIQNIAPQGCLGKNKSLKKGDVLLSVNGVSLLGISHAEAVSTLKEATGATSITLGVIDGPETCHGPDLFEPTWMYWHKLPRSLHLTRTVALHRPSGSHSLGFSLVGGKDLSSTNNSFHVLLVVPDSIAAKEGKLRCGDRIVSVNGHRLDGLRHSDAVQLLKQSRSKVLLEILSWPGSSV